MDTKGIACEFSDLHIKHTRMITHLQDSMPINGESGVLVWLGTCPDVTFAVDISEHFGLTAGRVANIVKRLEERGYIERENNSDDRRRRRIRLTDDGRRQAKDLKKRMDQHHEALFAALGESDSETLLRVLKRLIEQMEKASSLR